MKMMRFFAICALIVSVASCDNKKEAANTETSVQEVAVVEPNAETTLDIEGMTCEVGCKGAIEKHMHNTAGVASCNIDFDKAIAVIEYDNNVISEDEIIAEIGTVADHAYTAKPHVAEQPLAE